MQFVPLTSDIDLPFFTSLATLKIDHDKLDEASRKVLGQYEIRPALTTGAGGASLHLFGNALTTDKSSVDWYRAEGVFKNVNTMEEYKKIDQGAIMSQSGRIMWDAICDGTIFSCPSLLASFFVISYADLKKYKFTYWFAFPALHCNPAYKVVENADGSKISKLSKTETEALVGEVQTFKIPNEARQHGFFLVKKERKSPVAEQSSITVGSISDDTTPQPVVHSDSYSANNSDSGIDEDPYSNLDFVWKVARLGSFEEGFFNDTAPEDRFIAFVDPSTYPENPAWMVRNLLVLCQKRWHLDKVQILCYRDTNARRDSPQSIIFNLKVDTPEDLHASEDVKLGQAMGKLNLGDMPKVTGWERNGYGKLASKVAVLADHLDPVRLADQSVDLNLKLMKWRLAPDLDLERIKETKFLLLGAGTLGSYVARALLGWGARNISFVDNGRVSFSNPVRQPLFTFEDCLAGGKEKALQAAESLRQIYPGVSSVGHVISVPMAGHPVLDEVQTKQDFETLEKLFEEHDAIFLLMDTRESRWLPTVLGKAKGKIVINAALGFDTYMVMRHGSRDVHGNGVGEELGCYFCNDVVAPADSMKDQTLDQQCTVTRPGGAPIASALSVELCVSILQHPHGARAAPPKKQQSNAVDSSAAFGSESQAHPLGEVPHQIRGFLTSFSTVQVHGPAYDCCSACSPSIVQAFERDGWDFVKRAMNEKGFVEELSGLAEVQRKAEQAMAEIDWDDEGEMGVEEGDGELL